MKLASIETQKIKKQRRGKENHRSTKSKKFITKKKLIQVNDKMVSSHIISNYDVRTSKALSLFDWIGKVRCKKTELRRRRRKVDLRVAAILTRTIITAEKEMRIKQQERALKWAKLNLEITQQINDQKSPEDEEKHKQEVSDMWNSQLSELDEFINSLSQIKTPVLR